MSARAPEPADVLIGKNIRIQRLARRLSQAELAHALGVTAQQVQKYERGANRVGGGRLVRIAEVLDLPAAALLAGAESPRRTGGLVALELIADRQALQLVQAFAHIESRGLRGALVRLVQSLVQPP